MSDIFSWDKLCDEDKKAVMKFAAENNHLIREIMRNEFPSLYIGRETDEVARGWIMIAGREKVLAFIKSQS